MAEWHTNEPAPIVIIEGVSAGRSEWTAHLSFLIWIETPREERLRRGVDRDGIAALDDCESWMAGQDAHHERDPTRERADVVIDGTHPVERSRTDRHAQSHLTPLLPRRIAAQAAHPIFAGMTTQAAHSVITLPAIIVVGIWCYHRLYGCTKIVCRSGRVGR